MSKECRSCKATKPLAEFYEHPRMKDGRLNRCKDCVKARVAGHRLVNAEKFAAYERSRGKRPERRAQALAAQQRMRQRNPEKQRARNAVSNAIRVGKLVRQPCRVCGDPKAQAHHEDYSKPLEVDWLCFKHHREHAHGQHVNP